MKKPHLYLVKDKPKPDTLQCSFCGNEEEYCERLLVGVIANVCQSCVGMFVEIVRDKNPGFVR